MNRSAAACVPAVIFSQPSSALRPFSRVIGGVFARRAPRVGSPGSIVFFEAKGGDLTPIRRGRDPLRCRPIPRVQRTAQGRPGSPVVVRRRAPPRRGRQDRPTPWARPRRDQRQRASSLGGIASGGNVERGQRATAPSLPEPGSVRPGFVNLSFVFEYTRSRQCPGLDGSPPDFTVLSFDNTSSLTTLPSL